MTRKDIHELVSGALSALILITLAWVAVDSATAQQNAIYMDQQ